MANVKENFAFRFHFCSVWTDLKMLHLLNFTLMFTTTNHATMQLLFTARTEYDRRLYFQFVCLFTPGGGPCPFLERGGTPSASFYTSTGPMYFPGGTPVTGPR